MNYGTHTHTLITGSTIRRLENMRRFLFCVEGERLRRFKRKGTFVGSVPLFDNTVASTYPADQLPGELYEISMVARRKQFYLPYQVRSSGHDITIGSL